MPPNNLLCSFSGGNLNYGYATIFFVVVPFFLTLTIGKGYIELHEAATMQKFKQRLRKECENDRCKKDIVETILEKYTPSLGKRVLFVIQTFISFLPGLSWIPLPKEVSESGDESYDQTLLRRKLFELFGENAPQFILQLAIKLSKSDSENSEIVSIETLFKTIFTDWTIASSLFGLIMRSTTVYLELASKDEYGVRMEPYTCLKAKMIVIPLMMTAIIPRILAYSICFGSSFPLFGNGTMGNGNDTIGNEEGN